MAGGRHSFVIMCHQQETQGQKIASIERGREGQPLGLQDLLKDSMSLWTFFFFPYFKQGIKYFNLFRMDKLVVICDFHCFCHHRVVGFSVDPSLQKVPGSFIFKQWCLQKVWTCRYSEEGQCTYLIWPSAIWPSPLPIHFASCRCGPGCLTNDLHQMWHLQLQAQILSFTTHMKKLILSWHNSQATDTQNPQPQRGRFWMMWP